MKLPISPDIAKGLMNKVLSALIRMRLTEKNVHDLFSTVIYLGVVWRASDRMDETAALREVFVQAIEAVESDLSIGGPLTPEVLDICTDAVKLGYEVLIRISTVEYIAISHALRDDGECPLADRVLSAVQDCGESGRIPAGDFPE